MKKLLQKRIGGKRGFTLIEIIVVLVILAILMAAAVPTMLGFVEDAKLKAKSSEAHMIYLAAQAVATELAAGGEDFADADDTSLFKGNASFDRMIKELGTSKIDTIKVIKVNSDGKVVSLQYDGEPYTFS